MTGVVVVVVVLVVIAAVAIPVLIARRGPHPEQTASHMEDLPTDDASDRFYSRVDRPAGPDVEGLTGPTRTPDSP